MFCEGGVPDVSFDNFLAGKNRPTLPVFNSSVTSLNVFLLSASQPASASLLVVSYNRKSIPWDLHLLLPSPLAQTQHTPYQMHILKVMHQYFLQDLGFWLGKVNLCHDFCWIILLFNLKIEIPQKNKREKGIHGKIH